MAENHNSRTEHDILENILDIGIALTAESDPHKLLDYIVETAMSLTDSDAGTLYILHGDRLVFHIMKTRSKNISIGADGKKPDIPPVPLKKENICSYSVLTGRSLNIPDVYNCTEFDFSGPMTYDRINGYRTKSMVVIPLVNKEGEPIGVLQLINAQTKGEIRSFTAKEERIIHAIGSQATIALSNIRYVEELKEQIWSFTEAMTQAIDERTPYNADHTRKVAEYAELIARRFNRLHEVDKTDICFTEEHIDCLKMAALLHDIGKLVIPRSIMNKATRLDFRLEKIMDRLEIIGLKAENACLRGLLSREELGTVSEHITVCRDIIPKVDNSGFLDDEMLEKLTEIFGYSFECGGESIPFFEDEEKKMLSIRRGTLTDEERREMEGHVVKTDIILSKVHFNSRFRDVRKWASQHHECLDGSGYPKGIKGDELCIEARILAAADICDALLATDRPYKKAKSKEETFRIMHDMAEKNKIDGMIVDILEECMKEENEK